MLQISTDQLVTWVVAFMWPLSRILGLFSSSPLFSLSNFPMMARVGMGLAITILIAPVLPPHSIQDPFSFAGFASLFNQFIIGISIGFVLRIFFTAIEMTGNLIGMSMGMGFASFYDPQTQSQTQVISQFFSMVLILLFITTDLHLLVIESLVNSFYTIPFDQTSLNIKGFKDIAFLGAKVFSIGLQLSLPLGIGFPITMAVGLTMIFVSLPYLITPFIKTLSDGIEAIRITTQSLVN